MSQNILRPRPSYNRYYGDFRGVDFSSDHTQVDEHRLAYSCNMFKNYQSQQGQAIETIAGFRRRFQAKGDAKIYGIYSLKTVGNGVKKNNVLVHCGKKLIRWRNYPKTCNVVLSSGAILPEPTTSGVMPEFRISLAGMDVFSIKSVYDKSREPLLEGTYTYEGEILTIKSTTLTAGEVIYFDYYEGITVEGDNLLTDMQERKATSFIFNNNLYIMDGATIVKFDGLTAVRVNDGYIPTTYINIVVGGENADGGKPYEQRNVLTPKFKNTFIADGKTDVYRLSEKFDSIDKVTVYGNELRPQADYTIERDNESIRFREAPKAPEPNYPKGYAGVEIIASKALNITSPQGEKIPSADVIKGCTISAVFDNRIFLSGNPKFPNHIFYSERNSTGYSDPTYFGALNYMQDGIGYTPITAMIPVADTLMALKADTQQDGTVFFHSPVSTQNNVQPKIYPSSQGLSGMGCLGTAVNFLDDPIFISRLGVEAVGQLSVRLERAIEHRSSLIDVKLTNSDLKNARICEWKGYLVLLTPDGKMYLADSRQKYMHDIGNPQYEWYYLEDIGVWDEQYMQFKYASSISEQLAQQKVPYKPDDATTLELDLTIADKVYNSNLDIYENFLGQVANPPDEEGKKTETVYKQLVTYTVGEEGYAKTVEELVYYVVHEIKDYYTDETKGYVAYLCNTDTGHIGGKFRPAIEVVEMDDNIFFGTDSGVVCSFNFDLADETGEIPPKFYNFDKRTILCGCATKMDCCGITGLTKNTVKKSTVVKTKSLPSSSAKIKVRTNKKPYTQISRINSTVFSFDDMDFADFSFITTAQNLFLVKEKEKKWVEKQYYIYSDEYCKPFAIYYISFRYNIAGRYKEG